MTDPSPLPPRARPVRRWLVIAVTAVAVSILLGLSYWQYSKIAPKDAQIALIEARMTLPPVELPTSPEPLEDWHYRVVTAQGRYLPEAARHIYRAGPKGGPGYHLLVPFARVSAPAIWVDLGWLPQNQKSKFEAPQLPAGITQVIGQVHPRQRNAKLVSAAQPDVAKNIYFRVQPEVLGDDLGLEAITQAYLISPITPEGLVAVPPPIKLEHNHRSYAFQWLAMAIGLIVISGAFLRRS